MTRKRLLLGLSAALVASLAFLTVLAWWILGTSDTAAAVVLTAVRWALAVIVVVGLGCILAVTLAIGGGMRLPGFVLAILDLLFPLATRIGACLGYSLDEVRSSFIAVNNAITQNDHTPVSTRDILLLAPVCLQRADCSVKVTNNVANCRRCGRCPINDLLDLRDKYGFDLVVVTGGTIARKIVRERRPKAVIAVACERDLTSGIQETRGLRVIGIPNERPFGPCFNTSVDTERIVKALEVLTGDANA